MGLRSLANRLGVRRHLRRGTKFAMSSNGSANRHEQDFGPMEGQQLFDSKFDTSGDEMGPRHGRSVGVGLSRVCNCAATIQRRLLRWQHEGEYLKVWMRSEIPERDILA